MLAYSLVRPKAGDPERTMLFLHGILGTRANWRGIARRFVEGRQGWGAVIVDLREHGDSLGRPPPHTLEAAANDVRGLVEHLELPVAGALGHSFGGKVVLEWLRSREAVATEAWVIDASPSAIDAERERGETSDVLRALSNLTGPWSSREAFVEAVVSAGQPVPIAQWLAMNLQRLDDGSRTFGPELGVIRELLDDYARADCWDVVESVPPECTIDFVIGGRSQAFSPMDRERLARIAATEPQVRMHTIEAAGHWVHVDSPDALVAMLTT